MNISLNCVSRLTANHEEGVLAPDVAHHLLVQKQAAGEKHDGERSEAWVRAQLGRSLHLPRLAHPGISGDLHQAAGRPESKELSQRIVGL